MPGATRAGPERGDSPPGRAQPLFVADQKRIGTIVTVARWPGCSRSGGGCVAHSADDYRRNAEECYRLSAVLRDSAHKSFALFLANAWRELAEQAERGPDPAAVAAERTSESRPEGTTE